MFRIKSDHKIQFEGLIFRLKRIPFKKGISIILRPEQKYTITAPVTLSEKWILQFLEEKKTWVREQHERLQQKEQQTPKFLLKAGEQVSLLGESLTLVFEFQTQRRIQVSRQGPQLVFRFDTRRLAQEPQATQVFLRKALRQFYQACAKEILQARVEKYAQNLRLKPQRLTFRDQKTRWGSCSSNGTISLNWKLVAAPLEVVDYVVVHELCHLQHPNHSPQFWSLVETHVENLKTHKKWLRDHIRDFDFLEKTEDLLQL
ncbi:MAG: M48 family metallopeptidase [Bdellovibrionales bacterium]